MRLATKKYKQINSWKEVICFSITDATTIATDTQTVAGNYSLSFIPNTTTATVHFGANSTVALHTIQISYHHLDTLISQPRKGGYRYGFQGQEKDDEVSGQGNSYTAEFWQYDSRLGRRWNNDPDQIKDFTGLFQKALEVQKNQSGGTSDEMKKGKQSEPTKSNTIHWREPKTARSNGGYRRDATPEEKAVGDTVGGNPDINLYPGDKGHKPKYEN